MKGHIQEVHIYALLNSDQAKLLVSRQNAITVFFNGE